MSTHIQPPKLPEIALSERTPLVEQLLGIIGEQQEQLRAQGERLGQLEDELRKLKGGSARPRLKASRLNESAEDSGADEESSRQSEGEAGGEGDSKASGAGSEERPKKRRRGKPKRKKTSNLTIHHREVITPPDVPVGSVYKGVREFVVQDLKIEAFNTCYERQRWQTPDGRCLQGPVPTILGGRHYGPTLHGFVLHQYHHNHVTQPLLREQLREFGIELSSGELNRLLSEGLESFHEEKAALKEVGITVSSYVQSDDTGARHDGRNGYCTYIGNDLFAWFETTFSKSRINYLELLQPQRRYVVDGEALAYMERQQLAGCHLQVLQGRGPMTFRDEKAWQQYLTACGVQAARARVIATEGALISGLLAQGVSPELAIVSDGAGQFNVFDHALCWVHAERPIAQLLPLTDLDRAAVEWIRRALWHLYQDLKAYQQAPTQEQKIRLEADFDALCATQTSYSPLNQALARLQGNKARLLRVLERPDLPLHNNLSESDIREYVKRRKISAGTRSELGRRCRDTFVSLKKTCRKHGISFWAYLTDRLNDLQAIPPLAELIRQAAEQRASKAAAST